MHSVQEAPIQANQKKANAHTKSTWRYPIFSLILGSKIKIKMKSKNFKTLKKVLLGTT